MSLTLVLGCAVVCSALGPAESSEEESSAADSGNLFSKTTISGLMFGDAFWFGDHHRQDFADESGFWIRRIYLTFDHKVSDDLSFRLRFEANSPGVPSDTTKLDPFVKDAYIKWSPGRHDWIFGLSGTPTWANAEKIWGYRDVEKTLLDLQKKGSSQDIGVAAKGRFGAEERFSFHAMLGNGSDNKAVSNSGKKAMLALGYQVSDPVFFEVYGDVEDGDEGEANRRTFQAFLAYQKPRKTLGLQVARQTVEGLGGAPDTDFDAVSLWGHMTIGKKREMKLIARFDRTFDPNTSGASISYLPFEPNSESNLFVLGVDMNVHEQFTLIPNVEVVDYEEAEGLPSVEMDVVVRLTFSATF